MDEVMHEAMMERSEAHADAMMGDPALANYVPDMAELVDQEAQRYKAQRYTAAIDGRQRLAACPIETFGARMVIAPIEPEEDKYSTGGVLIPVTVDTDTHAEGTVVSMGEGLLMQDGSRVALPVSLGSRVLYRKHAGAKVRRGGVEYVILDLENLLGVLRA